MKSDVSNNFNSDCVNDSKQEAQVKGLPLHIRYDFTTTSL